MWVGLLQVRQQQLGVQPRIGKDDRLQLVFQKFLRHARRFIDVAAANAQRAIYHRWIVEDESFLAGGRAITTENFHFRFKQVGRQLSGIGNRCR